MPMNEAQSAMADRVRSLLADEPDLTEKAMFGTRTFLLHDKIVASVFADTGLLLRVAPEDTEVLMLEEGAGPALMGKTQREMGPGWLIVDGATLAHDERLLFWLDLARDFHRRHTGE